MKRTLARFGTFAVRSWKLLWIVFRTTWAVAQQVARVVTAVGLIWLVLVLSSEAPKIVDAIDRASFAIRYEIRNFSVF